MRFFRMAIITCRSPVGDITGNLSRTLAWIQKAAAAGADLVCFPELNITGYGAFPVQAKLAIKVPGPETEALLKTVEKHNIVALAGFCEANGHHKPFASHCVFQPDGGISLYRKLHLAPPEKPYFTPGHLVSTFEHPKAIFGVQLCYDAHFPELSTRMRARGAEVIIMPHASPGNDAPGKHLSWMRHMPARAFDNGVFVIAVNQSGENGKGLAFPGNALVLSPSGKPLLKKVSASEKMIVVELDPLELENVRAHPMRHFFPNRRPDLFQA